MQLAMLKRVLFLIVCISMSLSSFAKDGEKKIVPVISSFDTIGCVNTDISIFGNNFTTTTDVSINGESASFTVNSNMSITATVPAGSEGIGNISITNGTGTSVSTATFESLPIPSTPTITPTGSTTFCDGDEVTLVAPAGFTTYEWFLDGMPIGGNTQLLTATDDGDYTLLVIDGNSCESDISAIVTIIVNDNPSVDAGPTTVAICEGQTVNLNAMASGGAGVPFTFSWTPVDDLSNSNIRNPVASPTVTTTYTVLATDGNGCEATDDIEIIVNDTPFVSLVSSELDNEICEGDSIVFTATGPVGTQFEFFVNNTSQGAPSTTNQLITSSLASGMRAVRVEGTFNGCTVTTTEIPVTVNTVDVASIVYPTQTSYTTQTDTVALVGSPSGGVFSGNGVANDIFFVRNAGTGTHTVTYEYTNANGCISEASIDLSVNDIRPILLDDNYCQNASDIVLDSLDVPTIPGIPPTTQLVGLTNETSSGLGVTKMPGRRVWTVSPSAMPAGTYTIRAFYFNAIPLRTFTFTQTLVIDSVPDVTIQDLDPTYCFVNATANPRIAQSTGTFSWSGISGGASAAAPVLNLDIASMPTVDTLINVSVIYTDGNGCSASDNQNVTIFGSPEVDFSGLAVEYCFSDGVAALTANQSGGQFTGAGITDLGNGTANFSPRDAFLSVSSDSLNGLFAPFEIKYVFTNSNGCTDSITYTTEVNPLPEVELETDNDILGNPKFDFCYTDDTHALFGLPTPSGGPTSGVFSGNGIVDNNDGTAVFSPRGAAIDAGVTDSTGVDSDHIITYRYTDFNGCVNSASLSLKVRGLPAPTFTGLNATKTYCHNDAEITLTGNPITTFANTDDGFYVVRDGGGDDNAIQDLFDGTAIFSPREATEDLGADSVGGVETKHPVAYVYTDDFGCTNFFIDTITVLPLPDISLTGIIDGEEFCYDEPTITITGVPSGASGVFTGSGVTDNGNGTATFTAATFAMNEGATSSTFGAPLSEEIYYQYTDGNGCTNNIENEVIVNPLPLVTLSGLNETNYCYDDFEVSLNGFPRPSTGISGGFAGNGIFDNGDGTAFFDPEQASLDIGITDPTAKDTTHILTYTYTDLNGCINSDSDTALVTALPVVSFIGLADAYCVDDPRVTLEGSPKNSSSSFTGSGIDRDFNNGNAEYLPMRAVPPPLMGTVVTDTVTYTYTDDRGCTNSVDDTVKINPLPVISVSGFQSVYCYSAPEDTIVLSPVLTVGTSASFSGRGITDLGDGRAVFSPSAAAIAATGIVSPNQVTVHTISYSYTGTDGCTNTESVNITVNPLPTPTITAATTVFCYDALPVTITGSPADTIGIRNAVFSGRGITDGGNGSAIFSPSDAAIQSGITDPTSADSDHTITYTYTDGNSCTNSDSIILKVLKLPDAGFTLDNTGLAGNKEYCPSTSSFTLRSSLPEVSNTTATFSGEGVTDGGSNGEGTFNPFTATSTRLNPASNFTDTTQHVISLLYIDGNLCRNTVYDTVTINPNPQASFSTGDRCGENPIDFSGVGITNTTISDWVWTFGDGTASLIQNPSHSYANADRYTVQLSVTSDKGCADDTVQELQIGKKPTADFNFIRICFNDTVFFQDVSTVQNVNVDTVTSWTWDFGNLTGSGSSNRIPDPTWVYSDTGTFSIQLIIETNNMCQDTIVRRLDILPVVPVAAFPYEQDFESGDGTWSAGGTNSSWQWGKPNGVSINTTVTGENVWMTGLDSAYNEEEASFVDGPCFDFSSMERPMISMKVWSDADPTRDGAVLQYSFDDGLSWTTLGSLASPFNWYDDRIDSAPGGIFPNRPAWTGHHGGWRTVRHRLDELKGMSARLRIAFGSDAAEDELDGFAFDDIWVGERTQTVLVESFSNTTSTTDASFNQTLYPLIDDFSRDDVVAIQYHLESAEGRSLDPFYEFNPSDASARSLFYGVATAPSLIINGEQITDLTTVDKSTLEGATLGTEQNVEALFDLNLEFEDEPIDTDELLNLKVTVTANDTTSGDLLVYFAIIEREITLTPTPTSTQSVYKWTFRKLLPDGAGITLDRDWLPGEQEVLRQSWKLKGLTNDGNQMAVVAFIQRNDVGGAGAKTREVLQATYGLSAADLPIDVITSEELPEELENTVAFPNPAKNKATVLFGAPVKQEMEWSMINQLGQRIQLGKIEKGANGFELDTSDLPNGVYIVNIAAEGGNLLSMKLMVNH